MDGVKLAERIKKYLDGDANDHEGALDLLDSAYDALTALSSPQLAGECQIELISSRVCERGTASCVVRHKSETALSSPSPSTQDLIRALQIGPCNLMTLRKVVDAAIAQWWQKCGIKAPNGYAGEIAAALWTHLQTDLETRLAERSSPSEPK